MISNEALVLQAELLWVYCWVDLINAKGALEDLQLYAAEEKSGVDTSIGSSSTLLSEEDTQKPVHVLNPEVNRILDCLRQKNLPSLIYGEEGGSKNWYTKYLEFFSARTDAPRRRHLLQSPASAPAPSPSVGSPAPSPSPSPTPSPSDSQLAAQSPSPVVPFSPPTFSASNLQPTADGQTNTKNSNRKPVVVAVVVTATLSFVFAAFLFFCYCCRKRSGGGRNDERPLLSLSLSDYSIGRYTIPL